VSDDDSRNHSAGAPASGPVAPDDGIVSEETGSAVGNRFRALELERHIGERLRFLRRLSGFSQMHVAREIGVSFQQIQKYESGANRVSAARLFEICEALEVSLASMFERKLKG
jgi:DNA-binding XRE family transcriptional regulator